MTQWKVVDAKGQTFIVEALTYVQDEHSARFYVGAELVKEIPKAVFVERVIE
ncbi:hypothetical protein IQ22_02803 [Pseudomonas duriflava]|uniref:Uncharacterized protein n=1 Tax=Pseudomonas duriflava TaxID=459528 RepID=A0A562Q8C8_9PSED|nr:hypothetical protein [Pseudomonas duriflava]TWI52968.1 hypothetical protein IQ22_02803 [Pseudomonas duriflava]